jgi:CBS domain-containing protein
VVTERDIVTKVVAPLEDPREVQVGELVEVASAAVDIDDSLPQVLRLMSERQIQDLPVVDGTRLVGIVAKADVIRALEYSLSVRPVAGAHRD